MSYINIRPKTKLPKQLKLYLAAKWKPNFGQSRGMIFINIAFLIQSELCVSVYQIL